jgi:hypothetical protein
MDNGTYMEIMNKYGLGQYAITEAIVNGTKA